MTSSVMAHDGQNAILIVTNLLGRDILPPFSPGQPPHIPFTSDDAYPPIATDLHPLLFLLRGSPSEVRSGGIRSPQPFHFPVDGPHIDPQQLSSPALVPSCGLQRPDQDLSFNFLERRPYLNGNNLRSSLKIPDFLG
jgi:hypothetical protein